jgi:hypothetical protein
MEVCPEVPTRNARKRRCIDPIVRFLKLGKGLAEMQEMTTVNSELIKKTPGLTNGD